MEEYKSSKDFIEEVIEATGEAFESGFNNCRGLVGKLFFNLDLSGVTMEADLNLAARVEPQPILEVGSTAEVPQPAPEVPAALIKPKVETLDPIEAPASALIEVSALAPTSTKVISLEDDVTDAAPVEAPQVDA
ncbi:hypothetical protein COCNU_scaffold088300G000010 [Cocos nucifera]|nr:hypothetical protein [Cocos nucifera]